MCRSRNREGLRSCFRRKEVKETQKLNVMQNPGLDSGPRIKGCYWASRPIFKTDCGLDHDAIERCYLF